jgi:hypothetical protein
MGYQQTKITVQPTPTPSPPCDPPFLHSALASMIICMFPHLDPFCTCTISTSYHPALVMLVRALTLYSRTVHLPTWGAPPLTFYFDTCEGKVPTIHLTHCPHTHSGVQQEKKSPRTVDDTRVTRSQMPWSEGCPRRPLQLFLVQRQNVILQSHDLPESVSAFKYRLCGLYVDRGDRPETYDLLVISELEVVLYHPIFVPGDVRNREPAGWGQNGTREPTS